MDVLGKLYFNFQSRRKVRMREGYLHGGRGPFSSLPKLLPPTVRGTRCNHILRVSPTRHVTPFLITPPTLPGSRDRSTLGGAHVGGAGGLPLRGDRRMGCPKGRTGQYGGKTKRKAIVSGLSGRRRTFPACCFTLHFGREGRGGLTLAQADGSIVFSSSRRAGSLGCCLRQPEQVRRGLVTLFRQSNTLQAAPAVEVWTLNKCLELFPKDLGIDLSDL